MLIRFLVRDAPWDAGDEARVSEEVAEKLIRHGVAELAEVADLPEDADNGGGD